MHQLLISVSLYSLHQWCNLFSLMFPEFHFFSFNFLIYFFLMKLYLYNFKLIRFLSEFVCFNIFFDCKVLSFHFSEITTFLWKCKWMVAVQHIWPEVKHFNIMFISHLLNAQICCCLIFLHISIPGLSKLFKLNFLQLFNLLQFKLLSSLHLSDLSLEFKIGNNFIFHLKLINTEIF